jgi:predicted  nucleic acid-binding Zn-ribbon protein
MSQLPLNIPYLLQRLRPNAKYVLNGRSYGDIVWLDSETAIPSLQELENEFLRIESLESSHESKTKRLETEEMRSEHEKLERAKSAASLEISKIKAETSQKIAEIDLEIARLREAAAAKIRAERDDMLAALKEEIEAGKHNLVKELALAHNHIINEAGSDVRKRMVGEHAGRKALYPSRQEMIDAIRGGPAKIKELAKRMKAQDK